MYSGSSRYSDFWKYNGSDYLAACDGWICSDIRIDCIYVGLAFLHNVLSFTFSLKLFIKFGMFLVTKRCQTPYFYWLAQLIY
nr:hypothetical transcript [Hymenolepis microstoma]